MKREIMIDVILGKNREGTAGELSVILTHLQGIRIAMHSETAWTLERMFRGLVKALT